VAKVDARSPQAKTGDAPSHSDGLFRASAGRVSLTVVLNPRAAGGDGEDADDVQG
jgi:hypothetical protein